MIKVMMIDEDNNDDDNNDEDDDNHLDLLRLHSTLQTITGAGYKTKLSKSLFFYKVSQSHQNQHSPVLCQLYLRMRSSLETCFSRIFCLLY